jgi:hypothetical protein
MSSDNDNNITIETPQELIDSTKDKVINLLVKHFPDYIAYSAGQFTLIHGSTQLMIIIRPFTNEDTCVECISQVVSGATITPELSSFLLRKNAELHFGAFGLLFDDTITFSHSITGANLDENEFLNTIRSVATIADYYDDIIIKMAGGMRFTDLGEGDFA